jgi:hypothetical protein
MMKRIGYPDKSTLLMVARCVVQRNAGGVHESGIFLQPAPRVPSSLFPHRPIQGILAPRLPRRRAWTSRCKFHRSELSGGAAVARPSARSSAARTPVTREYVPVVIDAIVTPGFAVQSRPPGATKTAMPRGAVRPALLRISGLIGDREREREAAVAIIALTACRKLEKA